MSCDVDLEKRLSEREGESNVWAEPKKQRPLRHHDVPQEPAHQGLRESRMPTKGKIINAILKSMSSGKGSTDHFSFSLF